MGDNIECIGLALEGKGSTLQTNSRRQPKLNKTWYYLWHYRTDKIDLQSGPRNKYPDKTKQYIMPQSHTQFHRWLLNSNLTVSYGITKKNIGDIIIMINWCISHVGCDEFDKMKDHFRLIEKKSSLTIGRCWPYYSHHVDLRETA